MGHVVVRASMVCCAAFVLAPAAITHARPDGEVCTSTVHSWAGRVDVAPGASFRTGAMVSAQIGVQLEVNGSDVSTDVPAPGQIALRIGDTPVTDGAAVVG